MDDKELYDLTKEMVDLMMDALREAMEEDREEGHGTEVIGPVRVSEIEGDGPDIMTLRLGDIEVSMTVDMARKIHRELDAMLRVEATLADR